MPQTVARPCHREQVRGLWAYARQEGAEEGEGIPPPVLCIFLVSACWGCVDRQWCGGSPRVVGITGRCTARHGREGKDSTQQHSTAQTA